MSSLVVEGVISPVEEPVKIYSVKISEPDLQVIVNRDFIKENTSYPIELISKLESLVYTLENELSSFEQEVIFGKVRS